MGVLIAVLGVWFSCSFVKGDSKAVTTSLTTKWSSTPLLLETRSVHCDFYSQIRMYLQYKTICLSVFRNCKLLFSAFTARLIHDYYFQGEAR